jgi:hypothetical protein
MPLIILMHKCVKDIFALWSSNNIAKKKVGLNFAESLLLFAVGTHLVYGLAHSSRVVAVKMAT